MTPAAICDAYRRHLPPGELLAFRVDALDHLGVPVVTARLVTAHGATFEGIGYGMTEDEAMVGALGELSEEAHCERALQMAVHEHATTQEMVRRHGERAVVDPLTLCLPAGSAYTPEHTVAWVQGWRFATGELVWLPEEFAAEAPRQLRPRAQPGAPFAAPLITPITNGLGAGLSFEQALVHGLLELLQRDGNVLSYRALDRGVAIDLADCADPALRALLVRYRDAGVEVNAKVAGTDFGMLNAVVVGADTAPLQELPLRLTACGEAVHPDRERALRKALLEYAGSRSRKAFRHGPLDRIAAVVPPRYLDTVLAAIDPAAEEPRALREMSEWLDSDDAALRHRIAPVLAVRSRVPLGSLPTVSAGSADAPAERLAIVVQRLAEAGLDLLYCDYSPPGGEVRVVKAIVPGFECETMSYHRIGERGVQRLLERQSPWVSIGDTPRAAAMRRVLLTSAAEARLGGAAWLDTAAIDGLVGSLYPLYREPGGHAAPLHRSRQAGQAGQAGQAQP